MLSYFLLSSTNQNHLLILHFHPLIKKLKVFFVSLYDIFLNKLKTDIIMKKIFIVTLAALTLARCGDKSEKKGSANTAESQITISEVAVVAAGDIVCVDVMVVATENNLAKSEGEEFYAKKQKIEQELAAKDQQLQKEAQAFAEKYQKTEKKFAEKDQQLQKEMQELNEKYQKGLITTPKAQAKHQELQDRAAALQEEAQKEITALQKQEKELQTRVTEFQNEVQKEAAVLQEEEKVLNNRISDLITNAIKEINSDKKYKMIVNSAQLLGAVLDADESLNITELVLAKVNELYAIEKK